MELLQVKQRQVYVWPTVWGKQKGCVCVGVWGFRSDSKKQGGQGSWSEPEIKRKAEETPSQTAQG